MIAVYLKTICCFAFKNTLLQVFVYMCQIQVSIFLFFASGEKGRAFVGVGGLWVIRKLRKTTLPYLCCCFDSLGTTRVVNPFKCLIPTCIESHVNSMERELVTSPHQPDYQHSFTFALWLFLQTPQCDAHLSTPWISKLSHQIPIHTPSNTTILDLGLAQNVAVFTGSVHHHQHTFPFLEVDAASFLNCSGVTYLNKHTHTHIKTIKPLCGPKQLFNLRKKLQRLP